MTIRTSKPQTIRQAIDENNLLTEKFLRECMYNGVREYEHHGKSVAVFIRSKGLHRKYCLCYACSRFKPGRTDNCPIAQEVFELCLKHNLVLPVWECPSDEFVLRSIPELSIK